MEVHICLFMKSIFRSRFAVHENFTRKMLCVETNASGETRAEDRKIVKV